MDRNELLQDRTQENNDRSITLVIIYHSEFNALPSILRKNFYLISKNAKLSKNFKQNALIVYQINKTVFDYSIRNDILPFNFYLNEQCLIIICYLMLMSATHSFHREKILNLQLILKLL